MLTSYPALFGLVVAAAVVLCYSSYVCQIIGGSKRATKILSVAFVAVGIVLALDVCFLESLEVCVNVANWSMFMIPGILCMFLLLVLFPRSTR